MLITQNVDDLHERAGSKNVLHMHGELFRALWQSCGEHVAWLEDLAHGLPCPCCGKVAFRPDVVWFSEVPYHLDAIQDALRNCDLFAAIGTSGLVYLAAGFVRAAATARARTVELNIGASVVTTVFDEVREGPATVTVPAWVSVLSG